MQNRKDADRKEQYQRRSSMRSAIFATSVIVSASIAFDAVDLRAVAIALTRCACRRSCGHAQSPHAVVRPVPLDDVRWTDGFWADRFATVPRSLAARDVGDHEGHEVQAVPAAFSHRGRRHAEGDYHGAQWNDGDFYKFLEGGDRDVCRHARSEAAEQILDQSIDAIGRAQRADGYIHTPVLIRQRNGDHDAQPFQDRHNFEMYNMGHLITAACLHHRVTGRDEFLNIARKTADFLVRDVSRSDARAGPQFGLPVALHGDGRAVPHDGRAALSWNWPRSFSTCGTW